MGPKDNLSPYMGVVFGGSSCFEVRRSVQLSYEGEKILCLILPNNLIYCDFCFVLPPFSPKTPVLPVYFLYLFLHFLEQAIELFYIEGIICEYVSRVKVIELCPNASWTILGFVPFKRWIKRWTLASNVVHHLIDWIIILFFQSSDFPEP